MAEAKEEDLGVILDLDGDKIGIGALGTVQAQLRKNNHPQVVR